MRYTYTATEPDGKVVESELDAGSLQEVLSFLASKNMKPVSVQKAGEGSWKNIQVFGGKITVEDQIFLSKHLALMLQLGTSLLQALNILLEDMKKPALRNFLIEVRSNLERGNPFYQAFAKHPNIFTSVYVNLIKAGESSGNLQGTFEKLSTTLAKDKTLKDQIRGALTYPILLVAASFFILIFLITFALPRIAKVFTDGGFEPPLFSRIVFGIGLFFGKFGIFIIGAVLLLLIALIVLYRRSYSFRRALVHALGRAPVVRDVVKKIALQRFAATLSSLIRAGLPLTQALEITGDAAGHIDLRDALYRISQEGISKGLTVGEAFRRETFFPQTVISLIGISERSGHIEEVLETLADFYGSDIESSLKTLVSFLEPVLLIFIGSIVGLIALSVIVPIYQLTSQF